MSTDYSLVGKRVRAHLYTRTGILLGTLVGRVADVAADVPVGQDSAGNEMKKNLAYLVDIEPGKDADGNPVPYKNSAGTENEGWFAVQDIEVLDEQWADKGVRFN